MALAWVQARLLRRGQGRFPLTFLQGAPALGALLQGAEALLELLMPASPAQHRSVLNDRCFRAREPAGVLQGRDRSGRPVLRGDSIGLRAP